MRKRPKDYEGMLRHLAFGANYPDTDHWAEVDDEDARKYGFADRWEVGDWIFEQSLGQQLSPNDHATCVFGMNQDVLIRMMTLDSNYRIYYHPDPRSIMRRNTKYHLRSKVLSRCFSFLWDNRKELDMDGKQVRAGKPFSITAMAVNLELANSAQKVSPSVVKKVKNIVSQLNAAFSRHKFPMRIALREGMLLTVDYRG